MNIFTYLASSVQYLSDSINLSIYFTSIIRKCTLNLVEVEYNFRRVFPFWDENFGLFLPFELPYVLDYHFITKKIYSADS